MCSISISTRSGRATARRRRNSGDYEGEVVEAEITRIEDFLFE